MPSGDGSSTLLAVAAGDALPLWESLLQLRLRELLADVHDRVTVAIDDPDRVDRLVEAMLSVTAGLDLSETLHKIVRAAVSLVDAKSGALRVLGHGEQLLSEFIYHGIDDGSSTLSAPLLQGHGVLGVLISEPKSLRLDNPSTHPELVGSSPEHPPMRGFVDVPVQVFGNLYLIEKADGQAFSDDDEAIVQALADVAGIAIENTRLYEQAHNWQPWLEAIGQIGIQRLASDDRGAVSQIVAQTARTLTGADCAFIAVPDELDTLSGEVTDLVARTAADHMIGRWEQLANTQHRMGETAILCNRDCIAHDELHHQVVQQLFALGLSLQGTMHRIHSPAMKARLTDVVDRLHDTISAIRRAVFDLHGGSTASTQLRRQFDIVIAEISAEISADARAQTTVHVSGPLSVIPPALADHTVAVLREALTDAVKHARARTITIDIQVADELIIAVTDDGIGIPDTLSRRSGLADLAARARACSGTFTLEHIDTGGTHLRWSVPFI